MLYIYLALSGKYQSNTLFIVPFFQSSIIKHFQIILDNEWNNIIFQAFLEHNQSSHTTIAILKWMNTFKLHMKIQNIVKGLFFLVVVLRQQFLHPVCNFFWKCSLHTSDFIWQFLVITDSKPILSGITGAIFRIKCSSLINFSVNADFA